MKKTIAMLLGATLCATLVSSCLSVSAENVDQNPSEIPVVDNLDLPLEKLLGESVSPRWLTTIGVSLSADTQIVTGEATNTFSLFTTTVELYLELYYSTEFSPDIFTMDLKRRIHVDDLDPAQSVYAYADFQAGYWIARAYFREDRGDWQETRSKFIHYDQYGNATEC